MESESISFSEMSEFNTCRQRWHWRYQKNLEKPELAYIPSVGSAGHTCLSAYYAGLDWGIALNEWKIRQIETHIVTDQFTEELDKVVKLVGDIVFRYTEHYRTEQFKTVTNEEKFTVELYNLPNGDNSIWKTYNFSGYMDQIIEDVNGQLWLMENKFVKSWRTEEDVELDIQTGLYQWAALKLGYNITGTIYNQILAKSITLPHALKNGTLTRNKSILCPWEEYKKCVLILGQNPEDYYDMQVALADVKFYRRYYINRTPKEIEFFAQDAVRRVQDMRQEPRIYMQPNKINCRYCDYRNLCFEVVKNGDVDYVIQTEFKNRENDRRVKEIVPENIGDVDMEEVLI